MKIGPGEGKVEEEVKEKEEARNRREETQLAEW